NARPNQRMQLTGAGMTAFRGMKSNQPARQLILNVRRGRVRMLWLRTVLFAILVPGTELVLIPLVVVLFGLGPRLELGPARYREAVPRWLPRRPGRTGRCT